MSSSCCEEGSEKHGYWQESFAILMTKKVRSGSGTCQNSRQVRVRNTVVD